MRVKSGGGYTAALETSPIRRICSTANQTLVQSQAPLRLQPHTAEGARRSQKCVLKPEVLNSSPRAPPLCIFCMSLFVNTPDSDNQLVRSALRAWTVFRLTCSLHSVHCSLHSVHCSLHRVHCSLHRVHCSLHRVHCSLHKVHCSLLPEQGNPLKFTSFQNIHSWICAAQRLHTRTSMTSYTSVNI